jgi:glycosyltransferase involved in cell wall biosynthesis
MPPTVSVIIPAYNAAKVVGRAIDSALRQTAPPLEILVVDDGSTDETAAVVGSFPPPVRLIAKENGGPASARNLGARRARGEWLALLDADDWWLPTKLERQLSCATSADIGVIHGLTNTSRPSVPQEIAFDDLWAYNWIANSSVVVRRSVFEALGGLNEDRRLISVEDYNLWLRIAAAGWRIVTCPEALTHYNAGIGISSNLERFLRASLHNLSVLEKALRLPPERVESKRTELYDEFGRSALFQRDIPLARTLLKRAVLARPSPRRVTKLAASYLPPELLDARRRLIGSTGADERTIVGANAAAIDFGRAGPYLLVVIDAEEEFDWATVPSSSMSVRAMRSQGAAQRIFDHFDIVPTYLVDYAVASQREGYAPLLEFLAAKSCEIGAQLHPWINPPIAEELIERNSFPGNLPEPLEREKIRVLTRTIEDNFGVQPILYRSGRYGMGPNTAHIISALNYKIDCSVLPLRDLRAGFGPDFRHAPTQPHWLGPSNQLLEIPVTTGIAGWLSESGRHLRSAVFTPLAERLRIPGILARLQLLNRIRLSPEGNSLAEARRLTRTLRRRDDQQIFVLTYHSPSLEPGNTPYVRTRRELQDFLYWLEAYIEFFLTEIGGRPATPAAIFELARTATRSDRGSAATSVMTDRSGAAASASPAA